MYKFHVKCANSKKLVAVKKLADLEGVIRATFNVCQNAEIKIQKWDKYWDDFLDVDDIEDLPTEAKLCIIIGSVMKSHRYNITDIEKVVNTKLEENSNDELQKITLTKHYQQDLTTDVVTVVANCEQYEEHTDQSPSASLSHAKRKCYKRRRCQINNGEDPIESLQQVSSSRVDSAISLVACGTRNQKETKSQEQPGVGGHSQDNVTSTPILPPCRVCGDNASGFHYGANTCEACKKFFIRGVKRIYSCLENEACDVLKRSKRSKCPKCRITRCIEIGMSKDKIRNGRMSYEKKSEYIKEVKALHMKNNTNLESSDQDQKVIEEEPVCSTTDIEEDLEATIEQMTQQYHATVKVITPEYLKAKEHKEERYLEEIKQQDEIFGQMKPVSKEDYVEILKATGLDIDGRQRLGETINRVASTFANTLINLAKCIPGYTDLDAEDKALLIKNGTRNGCDIILYHKLLDTEKQIIHYPIAGILGKETFLKIYTEEEINFMFKWGKKIQNLHISDDEMILIIALNLLLADNYILKDSPKVEKCLDTCLKCLLYLCSKNNPNDQYRFPKIVHILTDLRTREHFKYTAKSLEDTLQVKLNPLWHELMN